MPLAYTYPDKYLAPLIDVPTETRAIEAVARDGTFPPENTEQLVVLQSYVLTCLECQKAAEDLFAVKLAAYRKEYERELARARTAQAAVDAAAGKAPVSGQFVVELFRG